METDFDGFVAARSTALFRGALVLTGNRDAAEDLVQETLERARTISRLGTDVRIGIGPSITIAATASGQVPLPGGVLAIASEDVTGWLGPLSVDALDGIGLRQAAVLREGATASAHRAAMVGATTDPGHQADHDPRPHRSHPGHGWLARCGVLPPGASTRRVRYMATINGLLAALTELRSDLEIHAWQPDEHEHELATAMRAEG